MKASALKWTLLAALALLLVGGAAWEFSAVRAIWAISALSDPEKLGTLGERGANPRLNKIIYWLDHARSRGLSAETTVKAAQIANFSREPRASLVRESLLRNLKIADGLGLLTSDNRERLRRGRSAIVTRGPYTGTHAEVDHIVPFSLAPEVGNELANLELLPAPLNRSKSNHMGERQLAHARALARAGLLSRQTQRRLGVSSYYRQ